MDESTPRCATLHVRWRCDACGATGTLPLLDGVPIDVDREAIANGHARRAPNCDRVRQLRAVRVALNGHVMRFGDFTTSASDER